MQIQHIWIISLMGWRWLVSVASLDITAFGGFDGSWQPFFSTPVSFFNWIFFQTKSHYKSGFVVHVLFASISSNVLLQFLCFASFPISHPASFYTRHLLVLAGTWRYVNSTNNYTSNNLRLLRCVRPVLIRRNWVEQNLNIASIEINLRPRFHLFTISKFAKVDH